MKKALTILFIISALIGRGQLQVDTTFTIEQLVDEILVGNGVRVGNIKLNGHKVGVGYFETDSAAIGMNEGVLVSTGSVFDATGENDTPGKSGVLHTYNTNSSKRSRRKKGDRDLNKICKGKTYDVNIIEFDFVPFHNKVAFNYCFASEEYTEYVGSRFNDVFAFIVKGPGVRKTNLAVLPNSKTPITINNVNHKKNEDYYINNDFFVNVGLYKNTSFKPRISLLRELWILLFKKNKAGNPDFYIKEKEKAKLNQVLVNGFQYDGFTTVFAAEFHVKPYQRYHIKIAIGDVGDAIFDSGVFLEKGSFTSIKDTTEEDFVDYIDQSLHFDFDSIFGLKEPVIPILEEEIFEITDVYFDFDDSSIPDSSKVDLDQLADYLNENDHLNCILWGYTDNKGSKKYNQKLSEKRALQVIYYLTTKGVERKRMDYQGNNFSDPIADNSTEDGRARNRRVEVLIIDE